MAPAGEGVTLTNKKDVVSPYGARSLRWFLTEVVNGIMNKKNDIPGGNVGNPKRTGLGT